jgi:hypothetical protein
VKVFAQQGFQLGLANCVIWDPNPANLCRAYSFVQRVVCFEFDNMGGKRQPYSPVVGLSVCIRPAFVHGIAPFVP